MVEEEAQGTLSAKKLNKQHTKMKNVLSKFFCYDVLLLCEDAKMQKKVELIKWLNKNRRKTLNMFTCTNISMFRYFNSIFYLDILNLALFHFPSKMWYWYYSGLGAFSGNVNSTFGICVSIWFWAVWDTQPLVCLQSALCIVQYTNQVEMHVNRNISKIIFIIKVQLSWNIV